MPAHALAPVLTGRALARGAPAPGTAGRRASAAPVTARASPPAAPDAAAGKKPVKLSFEVSQAVPFGQRVAVLGSTPELGAWAEPVPLDWKEGDVWVGEVESPTPTTPLEYKLLTIGDDGAPITWQAGPNRELEVGASAAAVKVADSLSGGAPVVEVVEATAKAAAAAAPPALPAPAARPAAPFAPAAAAPRPAAPAAAAAASSPPPPPSAAPRPASAVVAAASASRPAAAPAAAPASSSLSSMTVKDLKAKLAAAGLPVGGTKAVLIARLQELQRKA